MSNKILNLDLSKDPIMPAIVYGRVGDDRLQTVTVNLTRRDEVADLTGYDITFEGTTYNRQTKVFDSNNISSTPEGLKKGTFDYTFPNMAFAVAGKYEQAYFSIVKDGKRDSTAGFEIYVDGNADIDAPEAETIITEYNKLVAELNELQNQAIDEMNRNFSEAQGRISELEVQINDLRNKIDQALTDFENGNFWTKEESFNKEESSANVVDQVIGKESFKLSITADMTNSLTADYARVGTTLKMVPTGTWYTQSTTNIAKLDGILDDSSKGYQATTVGNRILVRFKFNLIDIIESRFGSKFWEDRNIFTNTEKLVLMKKMMTKLSSDIFGFGSGASGSIFNYEAWNFTSRTWENNVHSTSKSVTEIENIISSYDDYIDSAGTMYFLGYSDVASESSSSKISIDYVRLNVELNVSANEHIKSMIATYCGEKESGQWVHKADEALGEESDMNEYKEQGTFLIGSNHRTNQPDGIGSAQGWLTVFQAAPTSSVVTQVVLYPTGGPSDSLQPRMFTRNLLNPITNKWSNWKEITKMFASQMQVNAGELDDKIVSPKALKEASIIPIKISEWTNIPLNSTAEAADNTTPQYRIITFSSGENTRTKVELRGAVRSSSTHNIPSSDYSFNVSKLPSDIRPSQTTLVPCGCGHMSFTARGAVTPTGDLLLGNQSGVSFAFAYLDSLTYWLD